MSDRHAVYIMRDLDGVTLYVGRSARVPQRLSEHRRAKEWWPDIWAIELRHCESKQAAAKLEKALIEELEPLHNIALVRRPAPPRDPEIAICDECGLEMEWNEGDAYQQVYEGRIYCGTWACENCLDTDVSFAPPCWAVFMEIPDWMAVAIAKARKREDHLALGRMKIAMAAHSWEPA